MAEALISSGRVVPYGQPLSRIYIPPIHTLISKQEKPSHELGVIDVREIVSNATNIIPSQPVTTQDDDIGIEINLNIFSSGDAPVQVMNPAEIPGQIVGRQIPTDLSQARDYLHLIVPQRTGKRNDAFGLAELKKIAKSLGLASNGNKEALANRIRDHVKSCYNQ